MAFQPLHILGAGSIGLLWASKIRSRYPSYPLTLLLRQNHEPRIRNDGTIAVTVAQKYDGARNELRIPAQTISSEQKGPTIENLIVSTKSIQAASAIESVVDLLHPTCRIILLCNGALSVRDKLRKFPPKNKDLHIVLATTTHGAYQGVLNGDANDADPNSFSIVHAGVGRTILEEDARDISEIWDNSGLVCSTVSKENMEVQLWQKMAANCTINPLTALWRCPNGELLMEPSFPIVLEDLVSEISEVAIKSVPSQYAESLSPRALADFVYKVIELTSENQSSMLQDVLNDKRTEIDHLNGYVVQRGQTLGLECTANEDICGRIQALR